MKDYLMALYTRFCDTQKTDETFEKLCESLVGTFPDSRHLALALKDQEAAFCDDAAFAAFIAGFCLAGGIAVELKDKRYSFYDEVERTARLSAERGA